jgi:hypothetical protein
VKSAAHTARHSLDFPVGKLLSSSTLYSEIISQKRRYVKQKLDFVRHVRTTVRKSTENRIFLLTYALESSILNYNF